MAKGRPRSFDTEQVLAAATGLFWARGYQSSSLDEVSKLTGVNKPSLYGAFGDKAQLFRLVLERYHFAVLERSRQLLSEPSARQAVRGWLLSFREHCSGEEGARGCLSVNTTLEARVLEAGLVTAVTQFQRQTQQLLRATLERGKRQGELPSTFSSASAARVLVVAQSGLMALARGKPTSAETTRTMEALLDALFPPMKGSLTESVATPAHFPSTRRRRPSSPDTSPDHPR